MCKNHVALSVGVFALLACCGHAAAPACKVPAGQGVRVNCGYSGISECVRGVAILCAVLVLSVQLP